MTLPDDANERIARAEGWVLHFSGRMWKRPGIHQPGLGYGSSPPDYRNSLDAIEPVLTMLCPGWTADHHPEGSTVASYSICPAGEGDSEWIWADTLSEAMTLAALAAIEADEWGG